MRGALSRTYSTASSRIARADAKVLGDCLQRIALVEEVLAGVRNTIFECCEGLESGDDASSTRSASWKHTPIKQSRSAGPVPTAKVVVSQTSALAKQTPETRLRLPSPEGPETKSGLPRSESPPLTCPPVTPSAIAPNVEKKKIKLEEFALVDQIIVNTIRKQSDLEAQKLALKDHREGQSHRWVHAFACMHIPVLDPEAVYMLMWNAVGFIFLLYLAIAVPVYTGFGITATGVSYWMNLLADAYFLMDLPLNFITAYKDGVGILVHDLGAIARRYTKRWFLIDLCASIPWDALETGAENQEMQAMKGVRVLRFARLARLWRLLRAVRSSGLKDKIDLVSEGNAMLVFILGILQTLLYICVVMHWGACAWYSVGYNSEGTSWVDVHLKGNTDLWQRYVYSLYFTLTTMTTVGYGDISATNYNETCFVLFLLVIASIVFASLMGSLTDLISNLNSSKNILAEKKRMLSQYLRWRNVPGPLFKAVREHLLVLWEENAGYDNYEQEVKASLTPILRKELSFHLYGNILQSAPFLGWMRGYQNCLKDLANMLQTLPLSAGDHVFRIGSNNDEVHVLLHGTVRLTMNPHLHQSLTEPSHRSDDADPDSDVEDATTNGINAWTENWVNKLSQMSTTHRDDDDLKALNETRRKGSHHAEVLRSHILLGAQQCLMAEDQKQTFHAKRIQTAWRRRLMNRTGEHGPQVGLSLPRLSGTQVHAPAYFGEACLWQPFEEWTSHQYPKWKYSAICSTRVEMLNIPRAAIGEIVHSYSPWLPERLEIFRSRVVEDLLEMKIKDGGVAKADAPSAPSFAAHLGNSLHSPDHSVHNPQSLVAGRGHHKVTHSNLGMGWARCVKKTQTPLTVGLRTTRVSVSYDKPDSHTSSLRKPLLT